MRRLIRSRLIWISTVYKCMSEFTWCPKYLTLPYWKNFLELLIFEEKIEDNKKKSQAEMYLKLHSL